MRGRLLSLVVLGLALEHTSDIGIFFLLPRGPALNCRCLITVYRLGDNLSQWDKYRQSIQQILSFASLFQVPMVGADVCGFGGNTTEELCARWAALGSFYTFYRNHNEIDFRPQEFYHWPSVAESARKAIDTRYRLLDYTYTAFHRQSQTGEPFLQPLFYLYPEDRNTFTTDLQFFYGDALLVSPVTAPGHTAVAAYFPDDIFYDWYTGSPLRGHAAEQTLSNINTTRIPVHIRGGNIIPVRSSSALTTTDLRTKGFELTIAPGLDGAASGSLYLDDGESISSPPDDTSEITLEYRDGVLRIDGRFGYDAGDVAVEAVTLLGQNDSGSGAGVYDARSQSVRLETHVGLDRAASVKI